MSTNSSNETAFGGSSSWRGSLPALLAGSITLVLAGYGSWLLPRGLPDQYARSLERAKAEYEEVLGQRMIADVEALTQVAGQISVIHKRLIAMERGAPWRYWELATFQSQHAALLRSRLNDAAASFLENDRAKLAAQAERYESQAREMLNLLAAGDSEYQLKAYLQLCSDAYQKGIEKYGVDGASKRADSLAKLLSNAAHVATLSESELEKAYLMLVLLQMEAAWQIDPANTLAVDQTFIDNAWNSAQDYLTSTSQQTSNYRLKWMATQQLLSAFRETSFTPQGTADLQPTPPDGDVTAKVEYNDAWQELVGRMEILAVQGAWTELGFFLASGNRPPDLLILSSMGRTVCRLACSQKAHGDEAFATGFDSGLELVYRAAPNVPEFADLIWDSANQHVTRRPSDISASPEGSSSGKVAPAVVSAILAGNSAALKHSVLAISMGLQNRPTVARSHLQLVLRAGGDLSIASRAVLRQFHPAKSPTRDTLESLRKLQEIIVELEPNGGLNWFALANVQLALDQLQDGLNSLEKAEELLGEIEAIREMILQVKRKTA